MSMRRSKSFQIYLNLLHYRSTKVKCPFCDAVSNSIVEYRPSILGYLFTLLAMLLFGILAMLLMPFLVSLTKTSIHRCAKCLNEVKDNTFFGRSSLDDKLVSYEVGQLGIILTRRTLLYMVLIITTCLAIYVFILVEEGHNHEIGKSPLFLSSNHLYSSHYRVFLEEL